MDQLDKYLEGLVKQADDEERERARVDGLSFEELAHMAGIKLAESVCSKCGGTMEKSSTMSKCSGCGGMKKHARNVYVEGGRRIPLKGAKRFLERTGLFKTRKGSSSAGVRVPAGKAEAKMTKNITRARTDKITGLSGAGKAVAGTTAVAGTGVGAKALHSKLKGKKKDDEKSKTGAPLNMGSARAIMGTIGAGAGAGTGALAAGEGRRLKGALAGGALGGALGVGAPLLPAQTGLLGIVKAVKAQRRIQALLGRGNPGWMGNAAGLTGLAGGVAAPMAAAGAVGGLGARALTSKDQPQVPVAGDMDAPDAQTKAQNMGQDAWEQKAGRVNEKLESQQANVSAAQDPSKPGAETASGESLKKKGSAEKIARIFGESEPDADILGNAALPYEHRRALMEEYAAAKAQEDPTSLGKAMGVGGAVGGLGGLGIGALRGGAKGALLGGAIGGLGGAGLGAVLQGSDAVDIARAKRMAQNPALVDPEIAGSVGRRSASDRMTAERRHQETINAMGKRGSADVGSAAGKLLAKLAQGDAPWAKPDYPVEEKTSAPINLTKGELMEAVQAAKDREDIGGRARRYGMAGGAVGGLGGGLVGGATGAGVGKLLRGFGESRPGALGTAARGLGAAMPYLGGAAGAVGGGVVGSGIGKEEGAEEAAADMLVSRLRQGSAGRRGAMAGYLAGLRQGVGMAGPPPGPTGPMPPAGQRRKKDSKSPFPKGR